MSLYNSKLDKKSSTPLLFSNLMDSMTLWYAPGIIACLQCKTARHSASNCPGHTPKVGKTANPRQKIVRVGQAVKGKEKGADLQSDFLMEVEIPETTEIPSATTKTAAGIFTLPDTPQNQ